MAREAPPLYEAFAVPEDPQAPGADKLPKLIAGFEWLRFLTSLDVQLSAVAIVQPSSIREVGSAASTPLTAIPSIESSAGLYRINYFAAITQAASVSSKLVVTIWWTHKGLTKHIDSVDITGNLTTTVNMDSFPIRIDAGTPISYTTTYTSVGGTPMQYDLDIALEVLKLDNAA